VLYKSVTQFQWLQVLVRHDLPAFNFQFYYEYGDETSGSDKSETFQTINFWSNMMNLFTYEVPNEPLKLILYIRFL
jgi:hypothetical protein